MRFFRRYRALTIIGLAGALVMAGTVVSGVLAVGRDGYQSLAASAVTRLDDLGRRMGAASRMPRLVQIFDNATRLEIGFWQMGLDRSC